MHNIQYATYAENVNKGAVQREWDQIARVEGRREGCSGLGRQIRWYDTIVCDSYEDAKEFIDARDSGCYDQMAVRYRVPSKPTKETQRLEEGLKQARQKYREMEGALHFSEAKAAFIGCKSCGSKLARTYLKSNYCPLCRNDLRPDSTKAALQRQATKIAELEKKMRIAEKEAAKKNGKLMWLVKVEYHT